MIQLNPKHLNDIRQMIEEYPLERAAEAYDRMMSGGARFKGCAEKYLNLP
jgi:D-arabinose 1-dehydrogenase-like Zn-dependent alcohol dehydrogenase